MGHAQRKPRPASKAEILTEAMQYSRYGGLVQVFVIDALTREGTGYSPLPQYRQGETNDKLLARLLKADALLDRTMAVDVVEHAATSVAGAGLDGVRKAFGKASHMINPDAWHGVAVELRDKLAQAEA